MAGIDRIHGHVVAPATLHGGYTLAFFKVAGTNVGTADSPATDNGTPITLGNFAKAIRAIQTISTTVYLCASSNNHFVVGIDEPSASRFVSANSDTDLAAAIDAVVTAATGVSTTVTDISGLNAGDLP
jgi:hypothetical protein